MAPTTGPVDLTAARAAFDGVPGARGYCDVASSGLPSAGVRAALAAAVGRWADGKASSATSVPLVDRVRRAYGALVGVPAGRVALGSQVSSVVGGVAASLPDGARVVLVEDDFSSLVFPFLVRAAKGALRVRQVPSTALAEATAAGCDLVAFSLVRSSDGHLVEGEQVRAAARAVGASTLCDLTQAAGWLPVDAGADDVTVCATYKWLGAPRGVCLSTVSTAWQTASSRSRPGGAPGGIWVPPSMDRAWTRPHPPRPGRDVGGAPAGRGDPGLRPLGRGAALLPPLERRGGRRARAAGAAWLTSRGTGRPPTAPVPGGPGRSHRLA